jgi:hypothetical protein
MKPDNKIQSKAFTQKAREIGTDEETSEAANVLLGRLAKMPPKPKVKHTK